MIKHYTILPILGLVFGAGLSNMAIGDTLPLNTALSQARAACSGISADMSDLKKMAGINTAVTGVGTVAGGVALGTGIAKANTDSDIETYEKLLEELRSKDQSGETAEMIDENAADEALANMPQTQEDFEKLIADYTQKSKTLGNIRTGTLAGAAVTDTVGTIIASQNRVDENLQQRIDNCIRATDNLKNARSAAIAENTATTQELDKADKITKACADWKNVDLTSIDKRAKGATISGGTGAALAVAGTITSASANSDKVRDGDNDKEKSLNTASNVLAGGTTVASAVATIFNATQISAIKKAVNAADKCEEALR